MHHYEAAYHHEGEQHMEVSKKVAKHTVRRKWSDNPNGSMRDIYSKDGQEKKESWREEQHCRGGQMNSHTPPNSNAIDAKLSSGRCPFRNSYVNVLYFKKLKLNKKLFEKMKNKHIVIYLKYKETTCTSKDIQVTDSEIANLYLSFLVCEPLEKHEKQIIKIYIKYFKDKKYKILSFGFVELNSQEFTEKFYKKKSYMLCYDKNNNKYVFGYFVLLLANQIKWTICNRKISHEFIDKSYFICDRNNYDHQIFYICKKIQSFLLQSVRSRGGSQGHAFQSRALLKHFGVEKDEPLEKNLFDLILCKKVENILNNDVDHFVEEVQFILTHLKKRIIKTNEFFGEQLKNGYPDVEVVTKDHVAEKGDMKNERDEDLKKKKSPLRISQMVKNKVNRIDKHLSKQEKDIFVVYDDIVDNIKKALSQFLQEGTTSHEQNLNISRMKSINLGKKKKKKNLQRRKANLTHLKC
ncbi:hypothetical protein PCYB_011250, partial [Plasmodium cynomolgi strain B]